jgi:hypothetical protein
MQYSRRVELVSKVMALVEKVDAEKRRFTEKEKAFIKKIYPRNKWLVKYAIWKQHRKNGAYILFAIDSWPGRTRPTAMDNAIEVISTRQLTDIEYEEEIENFGRHNRVFVCWDYIDVDYLIYQDKRCGAVTPQAFVNECRKRGYTKQPDLFGTTWDV